MPVKPFLVTLIFVCAFQLHTIAQSSFSSLFHPIVQGGMVNGSRGTSAFVQAIGGVDLKPLYIGAGTGIDYYRLRSVPVFATVRKDLGKVKKPAFLYADLGYHFDWLTDKNTSETRYSSVADYSGGMYYDIGIGGRLNSKGAKTGFTLSAGYSMKYMKQDVKVYSCSFIGPCTTSTDTYKYNLARLMIKAGWIF